MKLKVLFLFAVMLVAPLWTQASVWAQTSTRSAASPKDVVMQRRIDELESRLEVLSERTQHQSREMQREVNKLQGFPTALGTGSLAFLFGSFCALWAQNTRHNPWLWFFSGFFFTGVAALVLLFKNSEDRQRQRT